MLTIETERCVSKVLEQIALYELSSQKTKKKLISNNLFNPYQCFKYLDSEQKGIIDVNDIILFIKSNDDFCTLNEAAFIILFNNPENHNYLTYSNFVQFLLKGYEHYSNEFQLREFNTINNDDEGSNNQVMDSSIEKLLFYIFKAEIELIRGCKPIVENLKKRDDYNLNEIFISISKGKNINNNILRLFLVRNGLYFKDNEIQAIITRLDINKNGSVGLHEFRRIFDIGFSKSNKEEMVDLMLKCTENNMKFKAFNNSIGNYKKREEMQLEAETLSQKNFRLNYSKQSSDKNTMIYKKNEDEYDNQSLSVNEDILFINFIRMILESEIAIEKAKCELVTRDDFDIEEVFTLFNSSNLNYLTINDLSYGFKSLNIDIENVELLMNKYDLSSQGKITFNNFYDMLVPFSKQYRDIIEKKIETSNSPNYNNSLPLLNSAILPLRNFFELIYLTELNIDQERNKLHQLGQDCISILYSKIDKDLKGYLTSYDIKQYCIENKIQFSNSETDLLFIRFDRDRKGKVNLNDIFFEVKPVILLEE